MTTLRANGPALIAPADTQRDFGFDTHNVSVGKLQEAFSEQQRVTPSAWSCQRMTARPCFLGYPSTLRNPAKRAGVRRSHIPRSTTRLDTGRNVSFWGYVGKVLPTDEFDHALAESDVVKYRVKIEHSNGRRTELRIRFICDRNGSYWLGYLANPTSLLSSYNAHAAAFSGLDRHMERRIMMRVPLAVLRQIIRSVVPDFQWSEDTRVRIKALAFRVCPAQIFTYLPTHPYTPSKIFGFLRCLYATPYGNGLGEYRCLSDDLNLEVFCKKTDEGYETLLFVFRLGGRVFLSVNFYDKLARAKLDAEIVGARIGGRKVEEFLRSSCARRYYVAQGGSA